MCERLDDAGFALAARREPSLDRVVAMIALEQVTHIFVRQHDVAVLIMLAEGFLGHAGLTLEQPDDLDHDILLFKMPLPNRSEEHTSELQSLMRISYAVFCLKKKKKENSH